MSRTPIAVLAGITFVIAYVTAAISIPDAVGRMNWAIEAAYWALAGIAWVFPVRWLMLWSVHKR